MQASDRPAAEPQPNLFLRGDTMLGVCEGLGQDFGFHPNWLRLAFAGAFYFAPLGVIAAYLALGLVVAASRLLFPASTVTSAQAEVAREPEEAEPALPLAA